MRWTGWTAVLGLAAGAFAAVAAAAAEPAAPAPQGGQALVESLCAACHDLSVVTAQGRTRPEWDEVVRRMQERGLVASEAQIAAVADYLAKAAPPSP